MTASVLKQDPNTKRFRRTLIILSTEQAVKPEPSLFLGFFVVFDRLSVVWVSFCGLIKGDFPETVKNSCKETKMTSSSIQWCQNSDLNTYRKTENSSQTSDRCLQELNLLCCSVDSFPHCNNFSTVSDACGWSTRGCSIWLVLFVHR